MPELPEVETVRRTLERRVVGHRVDRVELLSGRVVREMDPAAFVDGVEGRAIEGVERRGKYLLFRLSGGPAVVAHLRMTGRLVYMDAGEPVEKHTAAVFHLDRGADLRFIDLRKFGLLHLLPHGRMDEYASLAGLGVEPLSDDFTPVHLGRATRRAKRPIKALLLDQTIIAGIGNIYADEALFRAGIHPSTPASALGGEQVEALAAAVRAVLEEGVRFRGTTFRNYADGEGRAGEMRERLAVYGRGKENCLRCGTPLEKARIAGRGTTFCPRCQPGAAGENRRGAARGKGLIVGLTGGIASGKSTVARMLADLGAIVIDSDEIAHQVIEPGTPGYLEVLREFGPEILEGASDGGDGDGGGGSGGGGDLTRGTQGAPPEIGPIDRRRLGRVVFADDAKRRVLEGIVHPYVMSELVRRRDEGRLRSRVVVLDIPLLFEVGAEKLADLTMVVSVPEDVQLRRLAARDNLSQEEARARLAAQMALGQKVQLADIVIDNSGTCDNTEKQVIQWWKKTVPQGPR